MSLKVSKTIHTSATINNNVTKNNVSSSNVSNAISSINSNNASSSSRDLIKVCVRIRPPSVTNNYNNNNNNSLDSNDGIVWKWDEQSIAPAVTNPIRKGATNSFSTINAEYFLSQQQQYSFDHVFSPETTTSNIFDSVVKDIVSSAMQGMHGSVFMYGQTASGKTFTMNGTSGHNPQIGIIPQAVKACFEAIDLYPDREFLIRVSYLEVYNEQLKDLLNPEPVNIKILHDPKQNITILTGVKEQVVLNFAQVTALMKQGESQRHVGVTDMNEKSSRAHTIFKIIIESKDRTFQHGPVRVSTLNLIDLAGSESAKMTNSKGQRLQEARHINQSLLALSTIIQRLSEDHSHNRRMNNTNSTTNGNNSNHSTHQHLPFRDSKLTRLLETALDGNGKITIICTISPTLKCVEETSNTLKFGVRAKLIQMHAKINETVDDKTLLRAYREEIEQLKHRLKELEEKNHNNNSNNSASNANNDNNSNYINNISENNYVISNDEYNRYEDNEYNNYENNYNYINENELEEEEDEDPAIAAEQNAMLQMILEMERLILKADMTKHNNNMNNNNSNRMLSVSPSTSSVSSLVNNSDNATNINTNTTNTINNCTINSNHSDNNINNSTNNISNNTAKTVAVDNVSLPSPMVRGKNGEKRLSLTKLSNLSQTNNTHNSSKNNSTNNNIIINNKAFGNSSTRMTPGTQAKTRVVSLTKLAASTANNYSKTGKAPTANNNAHYSVKNNNNNNNSNKLESEKITVSAKDSVVLPKEDSTNNANSNNNNMIEEKKADDTNNNDFVSMKKKPNLTIVSDQPTEDNNSKNFTAISSSGDNQEDSVQSLPIEPLNNPPNNSNTNANTINNINSTLAQFSPAVMASLQLNNLLLRSSPSAGTTCTTSHGQKGVFFGGLTDVSSVSTSPRHNGIMNNSNPKIADVYSQMAVTASEAGVAPPAALPSLPPSLSTSTSTCISASQFSYLYPDIPQTNPESRPHPQMLLLSPARQRLQQHLQQQQHLTRSFYNNNNNINNKMDSALSNSNSNNNSVYRILSSDSFDFSQSEKLNMTNPSNNCVISHNASEDMTNNEGNSNDTNNNVHNLEETDTVLLNVSKMLLLLKDYIAKPKQTSAGHHHHNHPHSHSKPHRKSTGSSNGHSNATNNSNNNSINSNNNTHNCNNNTHGQLSPLLPPSFPSPLAHPTSNSTSIDPQSSSNTSSQPLKKSASTPDIITAHTDSNANNHAPLSPSRRRPLSTSSTTSNTPLWEKPQHPATPPPHGSSFTLPHNWHSTPSHTSSAVTVEEWHNLKFNLKLKEADNSFLQDEIANKDKMLSLLTEGLKEVEESQKQWLIANQTLSWTLQKERELNVNLWQEIDRLYSVLQKHHLMQELEASPLYAALQGLNNTNSNSSNNIDDDINNRDKNVPISTTSNNNNENCDSGSGKLSEHVFTEEGQEPPAESPTTINSDLIDNNANVINLTMNAFESY